MKKIDFFLLITITFFAFLLRGYNLALPREKVFDEVYYVKAAKSYLEGEKDPNTFHPPIGKMMIALGMKITQSVGEEFSWRFASLILGTLMVSITYLLGIFLTGKTGVAVFSSLYLALDFLCIVQSRIAILDIFPAFFTLLGFLFLWLYLYQPSRKIAWFIFCAVSFGLSVASKWNGGFGAIGAILCFFFLPRERKKPVLESLLFAYLVMMVYVFSFLPWIMKGDSPQTIFAYHSRMLHFRYLEEFKHGYLSYFWQWATLLRPIWYYYKEENGKVMGILAIGSPLFWWAFLLSLPVMIYQGFKAGKPEIRFAMIAYLTQYLLWAIAIKGGFFYYILPAVPWMAVFMGILSYQFFSRGKLWQKVAVSVFVLGVIVVFVAYYPLLIALPISKAHYSRLIILKSWI